jgi:hypothetical protein
MAEEMLQNQVDELCGLLDSKLRARGRTLEAQVHKAGRRLPRRIRRDAQAVINATALMKNPKLARMVDQKQVRKAAQNVITHLQSIDPMDQLKGHVLGMLGAISAVFILTFILVVYISVKRGLI